MTASHESTQKNSRLSGGIVAGIVLMLVGASALLQNVFGTLFGLLPLAVIFLAIGLIAKKTGLLIPGGILAGLSAGVSLTNGQYAHLNDPSGAGLFLLALGGGFALISLLSVYTEGASRWVRWPLFPAAGLAVIGTALLAGEAGQQVLKALQYGWPVILILVGLALMLGAAKKTEK